MKMRLMMFLLLTLFAIGCGSSGVQDVSSVAACTRLPSAPIPAAHYASRELLAKTVMEETARAMLDGQCKSAVGLTRTADNFVSVRCSDSGCDLESRNQP